MVSPFAKPLVTQLPEDRVMVSGFTPALSAKDMVIPWVVGVMVPPVGMGVVPSFLTSTSLPHAGSAWRASFALSVSTRPLAEMAAIE